MDIWLAILLGVLLALFVAVRLVKPSAPALSAYELHRRARAGDDGAARLEARVKAAPFLLALRSFASLLLVYGIDGILSVWLGGWGAALVSIALVLLAAWATRLARVERLRVRLYDRFEARLSRLSALRRYFFFLPPEPLPEPAPIASEEELLHSVDRLTFLNKDRRALIRASLEFTGLSVADAMSGRRAIHSIDRGEVLGPLVLDELYRTKVSTFVVTDGSVDDIVGILYLGRLTSLDLKDSPTAVSAMSTDVHFVDHRTPITEGLAQLRTAKTPFLVVTDGPKTVGLLSMDNIMRCLFEQE